MNDAPHTPVLLSQVLSVFEDLSSGLIVDGTLGAGGHSHALLAAKPERTLLGLDRDPHARTIAASRLATFEDRVRIKAGRFGDFASLLEEDDQPKGLLLDVGVSSMQLDDQQRGFGFKSKVPLDLRMESQGESALDLIDRLGTDELADILFTYGGERLSRKIASWVKEAREGGVLESCYDLSELCYRAYPRGKQRIHPATRTFQALRIAVNDELGELERALDSALAFPDLLIAVISFHSGEDRIAKERFRKWKEEGRGKILTKKPLTADEEEVCANPRSRSAKLRAFHVKGDRP